MSKTEYDDSCEGCRPAIIDGQTKKPLTEDSPQMKAVLALWEKTTRVEREAFHRVCCQNSRDLSDLRLMQQVAKKIEHALQKVV